MDKQRQSDAQGTTDSNHRRGEARRRAGASSSSSEDRDDRVYRDARGRPVGVASIFDRASGTFQQANRHTAPFMTPQDRGTFDTMFNRCVATGRAAQQANCQSASFMNPQDRGTFGTMFNRCVETGNQYSASHNAERPSTSRGFSGASSRQAGMNSRIDPSTSVRYDPFARGARPSSAAGRAASTPPHADPQQDPRTRRDANQQLNSLFDKCFNTANKYLPDRK